MSERPTAYLVDGSAYVFRAFYAIRQELTTSDGTPTNAVFGFKNILQKLIRQEQPHYLAVVFDERGPTFRHEADPTYKANRKRMPDELAVIVDLRIIKIRTQLLKTTSLSGLHRGKLGQHFFNPVIAEYHREFQLIPVPFAFLHHTGAKVLVLHLRAHGIGSVRRGPGLPCRRFRGWSTCGGRGSWRGIAIAGGHSGHGFRRPKHRARRKILYTRAGNIGQE